jgi:hypothetical protein
MVRAGYRSVRAPPSDPRRRTDGAARARFWVKGACPGADPSGVPSRARAHDPSEEVFASVLARACGGDGAAWEILYRWLAPAVAGYLRVQGARDVDDVTSEVFLALVRNVERFRGGPAQFRSFTFVIAHRRL